MDAFEASKREQVVCRGIFKLCDELYAATQRRPSDKELAELMERARRTQRDFQEFLGELGEGMKKNIVRSYGSEMGEVEAFLAELEGRPLAPQPEDVVERGAPTSTRRFEYNDAKSNKFWEISASGVEHRVRYGRIGSDGQTKIKAFESEDAARKDVERLVAQKTKKGYVEVSAAPGSEPDGAPARLRALLIGLCRVAPDEEILSRLCGAAEAMDDETVLFADDRECGYEPGQSAIPHPDVPPSFSAVREVVSSLYWDGGGRFEQGAWRFLADSARIRTRYPPRKRRCLRSKSHWTRAWMSSKPTCT